MSGDVNFYKGYESFKGYQTPDLKSKHINQFDREFWQPAQCRPEMHILEIGCGTGQFLRYLQAKGTENFAGIDHDASLGAHIHSDVAGRFQATDVFEYLEMVSADTPLDRVAMFDVLEHFSIEEGAALLSAIARRLNTGGKIVVRVPNVASPWGLQYQFGDLTHKAAYTPGSMRQLALEAGLICRKTYPQIRGSRSRRFFQSILSSLLKRMLVDPPEIWTGNFIAVLERPED